MSKPPSAGSIVEATCTRCRELTNHTIVAMVAEKIVRVECNACHGIHNYHAPKAAKPPAAAKKIAAQRKAKLDPEAAARAEWAELQPTLNPAQAIPYDMAKSYRVNTLLRHPLFGLGVVKAVLAPNKIEVLFQDAKKLLRCG